VRTESERLFFALWPSPEVRERLAAVDTELPARHGRPVHPQDRHITLVFLGEVGPERRSCAEQAADRVRADRFELEIDHRGYWRRPRILWCGPSRTPDALLRLVESLQRELAVCGFEPETRPYAPHVTLARKSPPAAAGPLSRAIPWRVEELVLVRSVEGGPPPRYEVLRRWSLG